MIGEMKMPNDFPYRKEYACGRPELTYRHPGMDTSHRAKIFAPFDALSGFDDAIASKTILYESQRELDEEAQVCLNQQLSTLHRMTFTSSMATACRIRIKVWYYTPCSDPHSSAYGRKGLYETVMGYCRNVDPVNQTITVNEQTIPFGFLLKIECLQDIS